MYLRHVHWFDYYLGAEFFSAEDMIRRSQGCLRQIKQTMNAQQARNLMENLDQKIRVRLEKPDSGEDITKVGGLDIEIEVEKFLNKNVKKEDDSKYRCLVCSKMFKGDNFVKKHIGLKHTERIEEIKEMAKYRNSYARDANRITHNDAQDKPKRHFEGNRPPPAKRTRYSDVGHHEHLNAPRDPRGLRSYVDLDAAATETVSISYD